MSVTRVLVTHVSVNKMGGKSKSKSEWEDPVDVTVKGSPIEKVFKKAAEQKEDSKWLQKFQGDNSSKKSYKK